MKQFTSTLFLLFSFISVTLCQDNFCATPEMEQELKKLYPSLGTDQDFENWLAPKIKEFKSNRQFKSAALTTLPIIFHVIHNSEAEGVGTNVSNRLISEQISQLNIDFTNRAGSPVSIATDLELNFCAATLNPSGEYLDEPGINRLSRVSLGLSTFGSFSKSTIQGTIKPATQWDPNQYINVWIIPMSGTTVGYAQFPNLPSLDGLGDDLGASSEAASMIANTDGIVMIPTAIGSTAVPNPSSSGFEQVLSHEIGHFLGLRHIWGDPPSGSLTAVACQIDDYVSDTPRTARPNRACDGSNQCNDIIFGNRVDSPDMLTNYMDYTASCFSTFTPNQATRVQTVLNNAPRRMELLSSGACEPPPTLTFPDVYPCFIQPFINFPNLGTVFDVCNSSALPIPPSYIGFYLSPILPDPIPLYFLDEIELPVINPGGSIEGFQWSINLDQYPEIPAGDYLLMAVTDHRNEFAESDEENNSMASAVSINILGNGCDDIIELECGTINTFFHNANTYPNYWEDYPCSQFVESNGERIFSFTTTQLGDVSINLTDLDANTGQSWAYLLDNCNPSVCFDDGASFTVQNLAAGTYYLSIEEYTGGDSGFTIEVSCTTSKIPCQGDISLTCNQLINFNMSNFVQSRIDNYDCIDFSNTTGDISGSYVGPEVVHSLFIEQQTDIVLTINGSDMTALLVSDCENANCLALAIDGESTFYPQLPEGQYFVIVEQGNPNNNGYQLYVDCNFQTSGHCPEVLNLYHGPIPSGNYYANSSVNGNTNIASNANVNIYAGVEINFEPNYGSLQTGSVINAFIEACPQNITTQIDR